MSPIALTPGKIDILVEKIREDVCRNPDANLIKYAFEFREMEKDCKRNLICALMLSLYAQDVKSLKRDLAKIALLGGTATAQATPSQRAAMLHAFMGVASLYFPELLAMYDKIEDVYKEGRPDLDS